MNYNGIFLFDISHWQGSVDFRKMKSYGASAVIMKASQGNWEDSKFDENWTAAKGLLPRASYHYYDNRYPPKDQARKYFDIIKKDLEGMCWLDLEDKQAGIYAGWRNWFDFIEELKALYPGARIGIYSGFYYMVEMLSYATKLQRDYFGQFSLWLAWYFSDPFHPIYKTIMTPLPWLVYDILQSGTPAIGIDAGVESKEIDYNQFNGDETKFKQMFGGSVVPPPPPVEPGETMQGKVLVNLFIRPTPSTQYAYVGQLAPNDIVEGTRLDSGWWKLSKWMRGTTVMVLPRLDCYAYEGASSGYIQTITAPPPPPSEEYILHVKDGVTRKFVISNE
jgi:GH25 family lysozyme M1 (1,4-beta-N-acetylmuramidase)